MSDVLQNATKYRSRLKAELARVEEFLRMAEEFSKADPEQALQLTRTNGAAQAAEPAKAEAPARAEAPAKAEGKADVEARAPPAGEAKTPFDRFRANGG